MGVIVQKQIKVIIIFQMLNLFKTNRDKMKPPLSLTIDEANVSSDESIPDEFAPCNRFPYAHSFSTNKIYT